MPMPTEPLKPCTLGGPGLGMDIDIVDRDGNSVRRTTSAATSSPATRVRR